ncbi:M28 family peptidase [Brevundimonas sp. NPDC092305]|uniref:M28 family peptidase n=1 Tax=Brevundimonas sp. NPDC092305 TaxID=3363957 RepID=UPI003806AC40
MRLIGLLVSLAMALALAALALQSPAPRPTDAPATAFSAQRAMADIRAIAQRPHPVGSPDHARVQSHLLERMRALGLQVSTQTGPLSPGAVQRLTEADGDPQAAAFSATNLIGVLPGRRPRLPAVMLTAHYDTTTRSPGAADDSTGVAAVLEAVRAIRARGPADRTLVVLLSDAEELNLDGARIFWSDHPLRDRIGAVVNLEARGGGGRAMMFETGRGNSETVALFADRAGRMDGGVTSNALAVFVYEHMPNGTDFTVPKERGVQGLNFAFIGRPDQYHSPASTVAALDIGSVQHIGSQALESADALLRADALPAAGADTVYSDLFGRVIVSHAPAAGWLILIAALGLLAAAGWRARRLAGLTFADAGRGMIDGVWFLTTGLVAALGVRLLGGPLPARNGAEYYALLGRLPWLEIAVGLAVLGVLLALLAGRTRPHRIVQAGAIALLTLTTQILGPIDVVIIGAGVIAAGLSLFPALSARSTWGGWSGAILLILLFGLLAQTFAPQTAFLFLWPALLASLIAAVAAWLDPGLTRRGAIIPIAVGVLLGVGWLLTLAHPVFLGIGMDIPGALALLGLIGLGFVRPLSPERAFARPVLMASLALLVLGGAIAMWSQMAVPVVTLG